MLADPFVEFKLSTRCKQLFEIKIQTSSFFFLFGQPFWKRASGFRQFGNGLETRCSHSKSPAEKAGPKNWIEYPYKNKRTICSAPLSIQPIKVERMMDNGLLKMPEKITTIKSRFTQAGGLFKRK